MDVASVLSDPELAFTDRHTRRRRRLPADFGKGSKRISEFHPRTEPVPSGTVSMGRFPPGNCGIRESTESRRSNQISGAQSFHFLSHRHHFILQGPAPGSRGCWLFHLGSECLVRSFCDYRVFDRRTSSAGVHFFDRRGLVYGRLTTDGARNSRRISGRGL